ncbi:hypothetical protein IHE45_04G142700 [Dioscorea alata]|uniref:Uncharacterized protein n=1 Tax=Dioscorea alata TaxID=55571 RepID=A0ACB7WGW7_DIOAL|nr:hypothetical protein IHE45_04G142700 [Dioscorea alata]
MHNIQRKSFVIIEIGQERERRRKMRVWPIRILEAIQKMFMCFFPFGTRSSPSIPLGHQGRSHNLEAMKTSGSSYVHTLDSHYSEAISDCIEFFNKSQKDASQHLDDLV